MAIFTLNYLQESKQKYDSKIIDRAADVFRKLQKILSNSNNAFFTLYPIRQDKISFKKKDDNNLVASYSIGKVNNKKDYEEDIRKIITDARYIINGTTRDCRVTLYAQVDSNIYSTITFFNCANKYILSEASKYNTSQYLEDDNIERPSKIIKHLSNSEIRRCRDIIKSCINKYPRIKKCCDYIDLYDSLQLAHKIILNSFYGYVMRKGSRWYSMEMAAMVTYQGSHLITDARLFCQKIGKPLELDTDGIWCCLPKGFPETYNLKFKNGKKMKFIFSQAMLNTKTYYKYHNSQYNELDKDEQQKKKKKL